MRTPNSAARYFRQWPSSLSRIGAVIGVGVFAIGVAWAVDDRPSHDVMDRGADLLAREWLPQLPEVALGDGLGPVYNEILRASPAHHQGGAGR